MVLSGIGDEDRHLRVLIEDLFYAAIVGTLSVVAMTGGLSVIFLILLVAKILRAGEVIIGRVLG
jgi:hypothetical protein